MSYDLTIKELFKEYILLEKEIKERKRQIKPLSSRQSEVKFQIQKYLKDTNQKGVKMGETVITLNEIKKKGKPLSEKERENAIKDFIEKKGFGDVDEFNNFLNNLRKPDLNSTKIDVMPLDKFKEKTIKKSKREKNKK